MFHLLRKTVRFASLTGVVSMSLAAAAFAQDAASTTGLGQAWPNAVDVSASPHWHVYVFERDGIRYVQINDGYGTVRAAVGDAGGQIFSLPVGTDEQRVTTTESSSVTATQTIYQDQTLAVMAETQVDGTMRFIAQPSPCGDPANCAGGAAVGGQRAQL